MKKQNVLIVHNYYKVSGGEDSVIENEAKLLLNNNHKVFLYTRHNNDIVKQNKLKTLFESIFSLKTYNEVQEIIQKYKIDVVHVHNTIHLISPSIYYAAWKQRVPIVQTLHNFRLICPGGTLAKQNKICEECIQKNLLYSLKNKCYRNSLIQTIILALNIKIHRVIGTYKKVDAYITLTEFNKSKFEKIVDSNKVYIKPNFIYLDDIANDTSIKGDYFLFVGRIDRLKGIEILLEAFKKKNNCNLLIAGTGPEENYLRKFIKNNKCENIQYIGFKTKKDIIGLIKNAKALIVPSQWYEGFPMTVAESFACGTPVIASNIGSLAEIVLDNKNGLLFEKDNVLDLICKIDMINESVGFREYLSQGALQSVKDKYSPIINYKLLSEIYNKVSEKNGKM